MISNLIKKNQQSASINVLYTLIYLLFPPLWLLAFLGMGVYGKYFKNYVTSFFNRYVLPPAFVVFVFFCVFKENGIYPYGNKTIAWCDMTQQGVPRWMDYKSVLEGDDSIFLNMANAAGMNGWSYLKSFLFTPFSYVALFLERASMMEAVSVLQVVKFATCSITAMVFFKICYKKLHPSFAVVLSLMYSFCAFGLMYSQIITWPEAMCLCPLYFAAVYRLINQNKICFYAIILALVMNNFPFGFMVVMATILFMGYYLIICKDHETRQKVGFNFVAGSFLAALMSATSWLPFFGAYGSSARGVDVASYVASKTFFTKRYTVLPLLMSTAFISVAGFSFKRMNKKPIEKAIYFLFGMMLIPMVIEPINIMWHGGSYTSFPARFAYILTFVGLAVAGMVLSSRKDDDIHLSATSERNNTIIYFFSGVFLIAVIKIFSDFAKTFVANNIDKLDNYAVTLWGNENSYLYTFTLFILFVVVYAVCYGFYRLKLINKSVLAVAMVLILAVEAHCSINIHMVPSTYKVDTESFRAYADLSDRIEDDEFYRVKNEKFLDAAYNISEANFPGAIGYASMGHYSSLTSETYLYFSKALGYSSMWMKVESFGGTRFSDALMCVKYGINTAKQNDTDKVVYQNEKYQIEQKDLFLPLGLFVPSSDFEVDLEKVERVELQEMIFDSLTGDKYNLFQRINPTDIIGCNYLPSEVRKDNEHSIKITDKNGNAYLQYVVEIKGTKTLYLDCFDEFSNSLSEKINNAFSVSVNGKSAFKYPTDNNNGLRNLGTFTDTTVKIKIKVLENVACRSFGLYTMDDSLLDATINEISSAGLAVKGSEISGNYVSKDDGYLLVSIPWNNGFKCKINGKSVEVKKAFGGLLAIPITSGNNSIALTYTPPTFYGSIILMAVGILLCVCIYILLKRNNTDLYSLAVNKYKKGTIGISKFIYACIIIAFVVVIAAIYIFPMYIKLRTYVK